MRPKLLAVFTFLLAASLLRAQQTHVDEVSVDTRATFHQQTTDGVYDSHFQGDYLNLHIKGQLTDNLTAQMAGRPEMVFHGRQAAHPHRRLRNRFSSD